MPPAQHALPQEIVAALEWLDVAGHVLETPNGPYGLALSPDELSRGARRLTGSAFRPAPQQFSRHWLDSDDAAVTDRVASIVATGRDGSSAGIWVDDDGLQRFVHLGSGSLWMSLMTDGPVDFLRLLARPTRGARVVTEPRPAPDGASTGHRARSPRWSLHPTR